MTRETGLVTAWLRQFHERRIHVPRTARVARVLAELVGSARAILDVGSGDGDVGRALGAMLGCPVTAVDIEPLPGVEVYDGSTLPYPAHAFDAVVLSDVLHHAQNPQQLLREALRVASRRVVIKDHYRFGPLSSALLFGLDRVGNASRPALQHGPYFSRRSFRALVDEAGGVVTAHRWPLRVHDTPFRWLAPDRLQFAASIALDSEPTSGLGTRVK